MVTYADRYSGTYLDTYGLPFPLYPVDLRCELQLGGTWTDVSKYVYQRDGSQPPVTFQRGKPDETQQAVPGSAQWQWNNRDGRFSPKNPLSPYYQQLARNSPVRWSVPATGSYLRLEADNSDNATVADNATLHITGSIEVRIGLRLSDWRGCILACKHDSASTGSWGLILQPAGTLRFFWYDSGNVEHQASSDAVVPYTGGDFALRVTMDATTGTVTFYTGTTVGGSWTQLGDAFVVIGSATTIRAGSDPLRCGWSGGAFSDIGTGTQVQAYGRFYELKLLNGIGGTTAADGIFSAQSAGTTSWTDSASNTWTTSGGAEISNRDYRYHGLMSSQPPKWDVTGNDMYVQAQAGGPLRLLGQGSRPPVMSPMKRGVLLQTGSLAPVAYWPMEDAASASVFGSATGGTPMGWLGGPPTLASSSAFTCSAPLPVMGGAALQGPVPSYTGGSTWVVRFLANIPTLPVSGSATLFQVNCVGGVAAYVIMGVSSSGGVELVAYDGALNVIASTGFFAWSLGGQQPLWWSIEAQPSGANVVYSITSLAPGATTGLTTSVTTAATGAAGNVTLVAPAVALGQWTDTVIGHVQVQSSWVSLFSLSGALNAWQGETAATRYARLAGENGYQARVKGSAGVSAVMGQQSIATLSALLQECETADRGQQFEARECAGLGYRTLASMTNQAATLTLSYPSSQPGGVNGSATDGGLDPTYDDLLVRNDWTVTRGSSTGTQGATVRAALNDGSAMSITGVTDYADTATVNVLADSQLPDIANWAVHVGTVDEHRWPVIPVNLARTEMASLQAAAMLTDVGDLIEVDSIPNVVLYDPVRQLALGFQEKLGGKHWTMEFQAVPASPYTTIVLDDLVMGRLDTDGSTLAAGVSAGATTLSVATTGSNPLWTVAAGDFPFDIAISGERITVTNITGSSSPQSFTVTRSVNGVSKAQSSGADVRLWFPTILALT